MSMRKTPFAQKEFYHLYNRGNSKQTIFHDEQDYNQFIKLLYLANDINNFKLYNINRASFSDIFLEERGNQLVSIGAYVLMPNHFHILITEKIEGGISKFMQKISTGYVMYYNKKYKRTGSLFEGKFKSKHLNIDNYLKYTFSYIHLNPIKLIDKNWKENGIKNKKEALDYLINYKYSSYLDYLEDYRLESKILNKKDFPDYFPNKNLFTKEIFEWLDYKKI